MRILSVPRLLFGITSLICAQPGGSLAITGDVLEIGSDGRPSLAVPGVEVRLIEFVPQEGTPTRVPVASTYTDGHGAYEFHPDHTGEFYIEVSKPGYKYSDAYLYGMAVNLSQARPSAQANLTLMGLGSTITGRVVDEDGQPVAGLPLALGGATPRASGAAAQVVFVGRSARVVSAADGSFAATDLRPGPYVVQISPSKGYQARVEPQFSPAAFKIVDRDFETSYWPGGASQPTATIPLSPGDSVSLPTIVVRKTAYYRAHVSLPRDECEPGEKWILEVKNVSEPGLSYRNVIACSHDILVSNLRPDTYSFELLSEAGDRRKWALSTLAIADKNSEVELRLQPAAQINGRVVAFAGASLPPFRTIQITGTSNGSDKPPAVITPDAEGKFTLANLVFPEHSILVHGLAAPYYVKEIRINGAALAAETAVLTSPINQAEIVVDDMPGGLTGTVTDGNNPVPGAVVRLSPSASSEAIHAANVTADNQGRFQFKRLAPGDYRIFARPSAAASAETMARGALSAQTVRVERGATASITLAVIDPSR